MSNMFKECNSLEFPEITKLDTSRVQNISYMFYCVSSLKLLSDISKWDTSIVINMGSMFYFCNSLYSLPDISKWNTSNVKI